MARLTPEQVKFMQNIFNNMAHNTDVVCVYLSGFFVSYDWKINGNPNAGRKTNNDRTFDYVFVTDYWGVAERNSMQIELQRGNESKAKQIQSTMLLNLVKEYKNFLVSEMKSNTGIQYRMTKDRFTKNDAILLLQILGVENTDKFVSSKVGQKIVKIRNIVKSVCNNSIKKGISLAQSFGNQDVYQYLLQQREEIKNSGMSAALDAFDIIFCWNDYKQIMVALAKMNPVMA